MKTKIGLPLIVNDNERRMYIVNPATTDDDLLEKFIGLHIWQQPHSPEVMIDGRNWLTWGEQQFPWAERLEGTKIRLIEPRM